MKIACCGSSGGGKTTLAALLGVILQLPAITHSRPTVAARTMGYKRASEVPEDQIRIFQWHAMFEQLSSERYQLSPHCGGFVADRSAVDFAAYWLYQVPGSGLKDDYVRLAVDHAQRSYDLLTIVPPNRNGVVDDGKRHLHGVEETHGILLDLLDRSGLRGLALGLESDTPQERAEEVVGALKARGLL